MFISIQIYVHICVVYVCVYIYIGTYVGAEVDLQGNKANSYLLYCNSNPDNLLRLPVSLPGCKSGINSLEYIELQSEIGTGHNCLWIAMKLF